MGGKRRAPPQEVKVKNADGSTTRMMASTYKQTTSLANSINSADISTLDRQELIERLQEGSAKNRIKKGPLGMRNESVSGVMKKLKSELAAAKAGTAPKYRYRKYLDQITQLQSDQPGQLQTVLSKGGNGSILGGGSL